RTTTTPARPAGPHDPAPPRAARAPPPTAPHPPPARPAADHRATATARPQGAPRARAAHRENSEVLRVEVRKRSLASFDAVGAETLERVAAAVGQVDVGVPPGIERHALQVAVRVPGARHGRPVGLVHQRLETLLGGRVAAAVETVEVERLLDALQVG